jgi:small subunit ribosomal protein S2
MARTNFNELLDAGVHFGHLKRKWNPAMAPYIFMEKNGIHIIDLHKTVAKIDESAVALKQIAKSGRKILFVATKKQAKDLVAEKVKNINMPYVTERWPGGMLTNFPTIRKAVKKMSSIDRMIADGTFETLSKRERLQVSRQRAKLEKNLGSIVDLTRLPAAMFVVDVLKEHIAVKEARRLNIPVFAMVDTNSDPKLIDFVIPANDDATKSISLIMDIMCQAIKEGFEERKSEKEKDGDDEREAGDKKPSRARKVVKAEAVEDAEAQEESNEEVSTTSEETEKKAPAKKTTARKPTTRARKE